MAKKQSHFTFQHSCHAFQYSVKYELTRVWSCEDENF